MNMRKTCPDIPDGWKGGISDVCRVLAEDGKRLARDTIRKYARMGKRSGGIDCTASRRGLMVFSGKEVKRFWREF